MLTTNTQDCPLYSGEADLETKVSFIWSLSLDERKLVVVEDISARNGGPKVLKELVKALQEEKCVGCNFPYPPWKGHNGWCGRCSY